VLLLAGCGDPPAGDASSARIAVAANFAGTAEDLAEAFAGTGGGEVELVVGSTGALHAQIVQGAPFDAFLAADERRPRLLEESGDARAGSRFVYAVGELVLWSTGIQAGTDPVAALRGNDVAHLAIANPELAPYGAAAKAWLVEAGLWEEVADRLVIGQSVAQVFHFVASGNAEFGFVAGAQLVAGEPRGSRIPIPPTDHPPIRHAAVLLSGNPTAEGFCAFLVGDARAHRIIRAHGYRLPGADGR